MKSLKSIGIKTEGKFIRIKKSLGQNFLKSNLILNKIIEAGKIEDKDFILEIGPGKGALTEKLLEKARLVIAVEKDRELFRFLQEKFQNSIKSKKLILIEGDILEYDLEKDLKKMNYKIIANIPYNITGVILKKFLTHKYQPSSMVLMVQHEVAKRIVANNKKESLLSMSVKAYGAPKIIMKVGAQYFSPRPKVDSAILAIENISREVFKKNKDLDEKKFWEILHKGFAHKRKKLSGNLKGVLDTKNPNFIKFGDKRAENLTLSDWISLIS